MAASVTLLPGTAPTPAGLRPGQHGKGAQRSRCSSGVLGAARAPRHAFGHAPQGLALQRPSARRGVKIAAAAAPAEAVGSGQGSLGKGKTAVVVGAGPAGSAAAMLLSKEGYTVKVFERRGDPSLEGPGGSRAFGIAINLRGQHALEQIGIRLPAADCGVKFAGSLRYTQKGKSAMANSDGTVCVDRGALARHMVMQAQEKYPAISFSFNAKCTGLDTDAKEVVFEDESSGEQVRARYDLLVACDGANSAVRELLAEQGKISYTREENLRDYKSFILGKELWASEPEFTDTMVSWNSVDGSVTRMWAVPNPDGTAQGMLTLYKGAFEGLRAPKDYADLLSTKFAGIKPELLDAISGSCAAAPVSGGGTMVKCSKLYSDSIALVGDAGHSMFPALGQGCNSAIESAVSLVDALRASGGDLKKALADYSDARLPEVSAAADISAAVLDIDGSSGLGGSLKKANFGMQIVLGMLLSKIAPSVFKPPVFFLVNKVGASYITLKDRMMRETVIINAAGGMLLMTVVFSLVRGIYGLVAGVV